MRLHRCTPRAIPSCVKLLLAIFILAGTAGPASAGDDNDAEQTIRVGDRSRSYLVHLPSNVNADHSLPLVIDLHGGGGQATTAREQTGFNDLADRYGFIVAYPNGSGRMRPLMAAAGHRLLTFNAGGCCAYAADHNIDDVGFIRAMVSKLQAAYPIDARRIYATGMSNGGMMSYRLACEASDVFAAVGVVSGAQMVSSCAPKEPVSLLHIHGNADEHVPFNGGQGSKGRVEFTAPPTRGTVAYWAKRDGCSAEPQRSVQGRVEHDVYSGCAPGRGVELYVIDGGGHAWPGGTRPRRAADTPSQDLSASQVIWQFFAAHPKPTT